jgi:hypothetical protein
MENILTTILASFVSGSIVFLFGQKAIKVKEKEDVKKKLNSLLYHLLTIRKAANERLRFNDFNNKTNEIYLRIIKEKFGLSDEDINDPEVQTAVEQNSLALEKTIFQNLLSESSNSSNSIKTLIKEVSETNPLFALMLKDFDVEEKHNMIETCLSEANKEEDVAQIRKLFLPNIEQKLIHKLDEIIHETTQKLDSKIQKEVQELLIEYDNEQLDEKDYEEFIIEFIINPMMQEFHKQNNNLIN